MPYPIKCGTATTGYGKILPDIFNMLTDKGAANAFNRDNKNGRISKATGRGY